MTETKPTGVPPSDPGIVIQQLRHAAGRVRDSSKINQVDVKVVFKSYTMSPVSVCFFI